jgi:dihydroorotate dehydrogenase (fumarate)
MVSLKTDYLGLKLKSPLIVGSSGLTNSVENIIDFEKKGAGAVVLKSLFEEQILNEIHHTMGQSEYANQYPEALDYISNYSRDNTLDKYMKLISDCKKAVSIPIIASINCASATEWMAYASKIQDAGADALELNIYILPSDPDLTSAQIEQVCFDVLQGVLKHVTIPVAVKLSPYFAGLAEITRKLSWAGAKGLVLFNRFYSPDIDIDRFKLSATHIFSTPEDLYHPLRWVALLSGNVQCDIAATTGVHNAEGMIKMLLAGAKAVEVVSTVYQNGHGRIAEILTGLETWMGKHNFESPSDFIGKMSFDKAENPVAYERVQFMKHYAGIE